MDNFLYSQGMCGAEFRSELEFWNVDPDLMDDCCWFRFCATGGYIVIFEGEKNFYLQFLSSD